MLKKASAVTLMELIIAITLLGLIVIGFSSIELFSRAQVINADKRAKLQNEVALVLEHMTKQISMGIGDVNQATPTVNIDTPVGINPRIFVFIDSGTGRREPPTAICYCRNDSSHTVFYCPPGAQVQCLLCNPNPIYGSETLSTRITSLMFPGGYVSSNNYLDVELTGCWDPDATAPNDCGTVDNPEITMRTRIKMPSVSTH